MMDFTLHSAKTIAFGSGTRRQLGQHAAALGQKALLVCGRGAPERGNTIAGLEEALREKGLGSVLFADVEPEPSLDSVERGREAFRAGDCDMVIAVGGGSALDVGKAIGALARLEEPVSHFFAGAEIPGPGIRVIALPTTAGTGAEVTPNSVLTDTETNHKASIRGHALLPEVALVDPELTLSLPPEQTAYSGLDALTQAIEAYTSTAANPVSDMLAEEAAARIAGSLRTAWSKGDNLAARENVALGSLLAGLALASARLGLVHGLAHPLGVLCHLPHGQVCAMLLPHAMEFNLASSAHKYAALARRMEIGADANALLEWVRVLVGELGAGGSFAACGLAQDDFDTVIPAALSSGSTKHNPREVTEHDLRVLLVGIL